MCVQKFGLPILLLTIISFEMVNVNVPIFYTSNAIRIGKISSICGSITRVMNLKGEEESTGYIQ